MITKDDMAALHELAFTQSRAWTADEFGALLTTRGVFAMGDRQAFALIRVIADEAELLTIATDPVYQRRGLARALMAAWMDQAARLGAEQAFLEVAEDNAAAIALYRQCGFRIIARRSDYYRRPNGHFSDALAMTCHPIGRMAP